MSSSSSDAPRRYVARLEDTRACHGLAENRSDDQRRGQDSKCTGWAGTDASIAELDHQILILLFVGYGLFDLWDRKVKLSFNRSMSRNRPAWSPVVSSCLVEGETVGGAPSQGCLVTGLHDLRSGTGT